MAIDTRLPFVPLVPQAQPVDTYVRPATPARSNLWELADALGGLSSSLARAGAQHKADKTESDRLLGEKAFIDNNRLGYMEAVKQGKINAQNSPPWMEGYKTAEGRAKAAEITTAWQTAYDAWDGKNNTDPAAFDAFFADFLKGRLDGVNDPDVLKGVLPQMRELQFRAEEQWQKDLHDNLYNGYVTSYGGNVYQQLGAAHLIGMAKPEGQDYEATWAAIEKSRAEAIKQIRDNDADKAIVDAVVTRAIETDDISTLDMLAKHKVPGKDYTYAEAPEFRDGVVKARATIEDQVAKDHEAADKAALRQATGSAIEYMIANPGKPIPPEIAAGGAKLDPKFPLDLLDWQKKLYDSKEVEDPADILDIQTRIIESQNMAPFIDAMQTGRIHNPATFEKLYHFAKSMEDEGSVTRKAFAGSTYQNAKNLFTSLSRTKDALDSLFGSSGISEAGASAMVDYDLLLADWAARNPNATPTDIIKAQATFRDMVREGLPPEDQVTNTYDRPQRVQEQLQLPPAHVGPGGPVEAAPQAQQQGTVSPSATAGPQGGASASPEAPPPTDTKKAIDGTLFNDASPEAATARRRNFERRLTPEQVDYARNAAQQQGIPYDAYIDALQKKLEAGQMQPGGGAPSNAVPMEQAPPVDAQKVYDPATKRFVPRNPQGPAVGSPADLIQKKTGIGAPSTLPEQPASPEPSVGPQGAIDGGALDTLIPEPIRALADTMGIDLNKTVAQAAEALGFVPGPSQQASLTPMAQAAGSPEAQAAQPNPSAGMGMGTSIPATSMVDASPAVRTSTPAPITKPADKDGVKEAQQRFQAAGIDTGKIDGVWGSKTQKAADEYNAKLASKDPYAFIPAKGDNGEDQLPMFRKWNADPVGNYPRLLASTQPAMQAVIARAQELTRGSPFVIGSGRRSPEEQQMAIDFGWSRVVDSKHVTGMAVDLWPTDGYGHVIFDHAKQVEIVNAVNQAAKELGVPIRAGANFSNKDMPHFELLQTGTPQADAAQWLDRAGITGVWGNSVRTLASATIDQGFFKNIHEFVTDPNMFGALRASGMPENEQLAMVTGQPASSFRLPDGSLPSKSLGDLLDFIAKSEGAGYNTRFGGSEAPLTSMSIDAVAALSPIKAGGYTSSANGRYQFLSKTLNRLKAEMGLTGEETFDKAMQDKLAVQLLIDRGLPQFLLGSMSVQDFTRNLAKEWASIPDPTTGASYYGQGTMFMPEQVMEVVTKLSLLPMQDRIRLVQMARSGDLEAITSDKNGTMQTVFTTGLYSRKQIRTISGSAEMSNSRGTDALLNRQISVFRDVAEAAGLPPAVAREVVLTLASTTDARRGRGTPVVPDLKQVDLLNDPRWTNAFPRQSQPRTEGMAGTDRKLGRQPPQGEAPKQTGTGVRNLIEGET